MNPYFVLFGGENFNPKLSNDIWIIKMTNDEKDNYQWVKLNFENESNNIPVVRFYHSSELCTYAKYKNKLIIFGGRDTKNNPLNNLWV